MKFFWIISFYPRLFITIQTKHKNRKKKAGKEKKDKDDPQSCCRCLCGVPICNGQLPKHADPVANRCTQQKPGTFWKIPHALNNEVTDSALVTEHKILLTAT